jgi:DNA-binding LacI/PurR family transcriptional regulator
MALGRTRVAHLAGPLEWREARDRRDGWLDALAEADLEPGPMAVGDWTSASGADAFAQILEADPAVDALFAASDQMALGAMHVANARGIRIPEQLAVVGFDGIPEAAEFTPSLTTIRQPLQEIGRLAVEELVASFGTETGPVARTITLPTELVLGDSAPMPQVAGTAGAAGASGVGGGRAASRKPRSVPAST